MVLTVSEAARELGLTPDGVRWLERSGKLRATRTPSGVRLFQRREVERLVAERAQKSGRAVA